MNILGSIVDFKFLNPNGIMQLFDKNLTISKLLNFKLKLLPTNMQNLGMESDNIAVNLSPFLILILLYALLIALLSLLMLIPKSQGNLKEFID
jgi:hypothetical protein